MSDTVFPPETLAQGARASGAFGVLQKGVPEFSAIVHVQISERLRFDVETDLHLEIV